ncbi:hypothetical protein BD309DRAFT_965253 [Dichomitus squalens]|nr:hypothetical protein BD309DRAFT_965253 [Dichomitus squalens]
MIPSGSRHGPDCRCSGTLIDTMVTRRCGRHVHKEMVTRLVRRLTRYSALEGRQSPLVLDIGYDANRWNQQLAMLLQVLIMPGPLCLRVYGRLRPGFKLPSRGWRQWTLNVQSELCTGPRHLEIIGVSFGATAGLIPVQIDCLRCGMMPETRVWSGTLQQERESIWLAKKTEGDKEQENSSSFRMLQKCPTCEPSLTRCPAQQST